MLRRTVLLGLLAAAALVPASAHAAVQAVKVGSFNAPVYVTAPPGDTDRLMVVEQSGRIDVMVDGQKQATPFLDITNKVKQPGPPIPEQGLLSMAFAPDYATSGKFFVYYTSLDNCDSSHGCDEHVSEFTRSATNPNVADPGSERVLLSIPHPGATNHNGGQLQFGPDGYLYISTGDGGGANDQFKNAQLTDPGQPGYLLGKILRIDPFHGSPYAIPPGNPFGPDNPIWAYGLRNPWRFSFDRLTGDMIIGDVGEHAFEEIDFSAPGQNAGANYGWSCYEGKLPNASAADDCDPEPSPRVDPVFVYPHCLNAGSAPFCGSGIIGGYVVRDPSLPELYGRYIYGDLSSSGTKGLRSISLPAANDDRSVPIDVSSLSSFGEDAAGCIYAASLGANAVYRIAPSTDPTPGPCGQRQAPVPGAAPPAPERIPPSIRLGYRRHQRILKTHSIKLALAVSEQAAVSATATVNVGRSARVIRFKRVKRNIPRGKRRIVRLHLSKRSLKLMRRALRHHRSYLAKVTVSAHDAAGNSSSKRRSIRLVR